MPTIQRGLRALSERQREILRLTARHHQLKEIARLLNISENTVKTHMAEARRRLGGITTKQAIRLLLADEESISLTLEGGDPEVVIPDTVSLMPPWLYEQASSTPDPRTHQFRPCADISSNAGDAQQALEDSGRYPRFEGHLSGSRGSSNDLQFNRIDGKLDGLRADEEAGKENVEKAGKSRWGEFRRRLKTLPAIQVIGLMVIAAIVLALFAGMLVATLLGVVEVVHKLTIYAGWK